MKIIAIEDPKMGGYTAFHQDFPSVIIQAEEESEIKEQIINVFNDIILNSEIVVKRLNEVK